jgi:Flp pilus assembly protein TadG
MPLKTLFDRLRRTARELRTANGANVTFTFALATIPMVGFVGAAVDYSHANSVKTALQAATDAAALMLSKTASSLTNAQLQTQGFNQVQALFNRPEATGFTVNVTYNTSGGNQIVVLSSANVKTNLMNLMGFSTMKVSADAQVKWGNSRLRVALVLDNTGSMAQDGKMTALKTATNNLIDQLKGAAVNNGDVYVSIIPFVEDVKRRLQQT